MQNHTPVWEMQTSAATSPLLVSVASTANLAGHNVFTSVVDRHKNMNLKTTSMATEQVGSIQPI